jgi:polyvinyl alcohol dehydrogenase (cytochrome)
MYAYSTTDGHMLWQFDTNKDFLTVNGVAAKGGSLNGATGPVISRGMLYVTSGYADLGGGMRGNVLLAFGAQ